MPLTDEAICSVCFSQTGVIAHVTGSSFHKYCYEEQEKRKQFLGRILIKQFKNKNHEFNNRQK